MIYNVVHLSVSETFNLSKNDEIHHAIHQLAPVFWQCSRHSSPSSGRVHIATRPPFLGGSILPVLQFCDGSFRCQTSSSGKVHFASTPPFLGGSFLPPPFREGSFCCQASSSGKVHSAASGLQFWEGSFRC